jgi:hypothetical protein
MPLISADKTTTERAPLFAHVDIADNHETVALTGLFEERKRSLARAVLRKGVGDNRNK